nr:putative reverse transcriptase, RNA-dependent DNA polymerase [Tanacetum cinerariifolium]
MHPTFCLLQDIRTRRIIGRVTKREGLYYVDEVNTSGTVMLAHGTSERDAWLWHRRLGHPFVGYLHTLFPELFLLSKPISCETCILAKSHRQTFKPGNTRVKWSGKEQCDTLSWLRYTSKECCPNQNTISVRAQERSSLNISATEDTVPNLISEVTIKYVLPVRSNRGIPPKRYTTEKTSRSSKYPIANIARGNLSNEAKAFFASVYLEEAPSNVEQALKSEKWKNVMDVEMNALMRNRTWDKCILPQRKKHAPHGFSQQFKHGEVCKLKKSLYGLKQSPRVWFGRFTLAMKKYGYKQSNSDHTLFLSHRGDRVTCLIIYVDDIIITGNDESEIKKLKEGLCTEFEMKDLGNLRYFLGIEVMRSQQGIFICQKKYILDLLAEIGMIDVTPPKWATTEYDVPGVLLHRSIAQEMRMASKKLFEN